MPLYKGNSLIRSVYKGNKMCLAIFNGATLVHPGGQSTKCCVSGGASTLLTQANGGLWITGSGHAHPNYSYLGIDKFYQGNSLWTSGPANNGALYFNNSSGSTQTVTVYGCLKFVSPFAGSVAIQTAISNQLPGVGGFSNPRTTYASVIIGTNFINFTHTLDVLNNFALFPLFIGLVNVSYSVSEFCITVI